MQVNRTIGFPKSLKQNLPQINLKQILGVAGIGYGLTLFSKLSPSYQLAAMTLGGILGGFLGDYIDNKQKQDFSEAIEKKDIDAIKKLIAEGCDPNYVETYYDRYLDDKEIVRYKEIKKPILFKFIQGRSPEEIKFLEEFLKIQNVDVNVQDHNQSTALHHAAAQGDIKVLKLLLNCGASDCYTVTNNDNKIPLELIPKGKEEVLRDFMQYFMQTVEVFSGKTREQAAVKIQTAWKKFKERKEKA